MRSSLSPRSRWPPAVAPVRTRPASIVLSSVLLLSITLLSTELISTSPAAGAAEAGHIAGAPAGSAPAASGFILPVPPPPLVLTPFTAPPSRYGAGHRGVDLAAAISSVVLAAGSGTVVFAGELAGRGVISVEHSGGLRTTYEPVDPLVRAGDPVAAGQPIARLQSGHPGCSPASCLHWGARLPDRVYLDPMSLLGPWRVRLLPWEGR